MKEYIIKIGDEPDIMGNYPLTEKAKELVRCKDCKYCNDNDYVCEHPNEWGNEDTRNQRNPEWYCADGERK